MTEEELKVIQKECKKIKTILGHKNEYLGSALNFSESTVLQALNNKDKDAYRKISNLQNIHSFLLAEINQKKKNFGLRSKLLEIEKKEEIVSIMEVFNRLLEITDPDGVNEIEINHDIYNVDGYFIGAYSDAILQYSLSNANKQEEGLYASTIAKLEGGKEFLVFTTDQIGNGEIISVNSLSQAVNLVVKGLEEDYDEKVRDFFNQVNDELGN